MRYTYEIETATGKWVKCSKAVELPTGWLEYSLRDRSVGLKRPGTWRKVESKQLRKAIR